MPDRIKDSLRRFADSTPEFSAACDENHHLVLGPGKELTDEWTAAGLTIPDSEATRQWRMGRISEQLDELGYDGAILMDPMNIRYATDTTNMQIWVMHNATRYAWVGADGSIIMWDFYGCEFMSGHNPHVDEVRPAISSIYFVAGDRYEEKARDWADEMLSVIGEHCGENPRIAVDTAPYLNLKFLEAGGVTIGNGQEVMELARRIKGPDEIAAMRCAMHACESTMAEMHKQLRPGMTEREVWAGLHAGNIRRGGEWIETQILASGPRTNPWMQEASSRVIEPGDLVGYDTDLVGAYGMMVDISRTWLVGADTPTAAQQHTWSIAADQIAYNMDLLRPGTTYEELTHKAMVPPVDEYRHYCVLYHGVGQCDETPEIVFPEQWDEWGVNGVLEPGMVLTAESFVGAYSGGEGVKLEEQVLITADGPEMLSSYPLGLT